MVTKDGYNLGKVGLRGEAHKVSIQPNPRILRRDHGVFISGSGARHFTAKQTFSFGEEKILTPHLRYPSSSTSIAFSALVNLFALYPSPS